MKIRILGGVNEKGRVGFEILDEKLVLDFGVKRKPGGKREEIYPLMPEEAKYLFISHVHTDHTGAVPLLEDIKIMTTDETFSRIKDYIAGWVKTCKLWKLPIDEDKYQKFLKKDINKVPFPDEWMVGVSGHVPGSVWVKIDQLLYTGDMNPSSPSFDIDLLPKAKILIMDMAYGDEELPGPEFLLNVIEKSKDKRIIMPLPPFGRSQEILDFLLKNGVNPIFVDEVILKNYKGKFENKDITGYPTGIYLACDGMMTSGKSLELFKKFENDKETLFLITGHAEVGTPAHDILKKNGIRIIWKIHPSPPECIEIVKKVEPEVVIPFHSTFESAKKTLNKIEKLGVKVLRPRIGEVIKV